jgi:DNA (cytosine-5)-methyltransferase 1
MILGKSTPCRESLQGADKKPGQFENPFRSSSSNSFYDAANSFSPNHVATEPLSKDKDEISEEGESSSASSTQSAGFSSPAGSPVCESNQYPDKSESESELDEDVFGSDGHDQPLVSESETLRGSFQQGHGQASLQPSQLTIPRSKYHGYKPPLDICEEKVAVKELMDALKQQKLANQSSGPNNSEYDAYFEELELSNFAVYLPPSNTWHPCEMQGLQVLATRTGRGSFYFDGILSIGSTRRYVQGVPFKICSIGNYGKDSDEVGRDIWIQSVWNEKSKSNIFYRLATPSSEYERFHEGFLWLANLAKHFVDFCQSSEHPVSIHHFRFDFYAWLEQTHGASLAFNSWYQEYGNQDFRRAVARNIHFLFKESVGVDGGLRSQPIWRETMERDSIPNQQIQEKMTVVTPYVYECFKDISFGHHLLPIEPSSISKMQQTKQGKALDLTTSSLSARKPNKSPANRIPIRLTEVTDQVHTVQKMIKSIKIGDVLSVTKDGQGSVWKDEASQWKAASNCWYVCVQGIHESKNGQKSYDAIWLYSPADTMCGLMKYPWPNELFLSDNCTCSHKRVKEDEILDVVSVLWHGYPSEAGGRLVVRQTYLENERFVTLREAHKKCEHLKERDQTGTSINLSKYPIGQTVLIAPSQKPRHGLEPYEIIKYITEGSKHFAVLNRLRRRREIDGSGRPNELVYTTSHTEKVSVNKLERTCLVRFYRESDAEDRRIPAPYSRDGTGNAFYITSRLSEENGTSKLIPIEEDLPQTLIQGFDPTSIPPESRKVLRGMDLYCGGGNFGRGIEEGGAVHNEWAVDLNKNAIHTYSANLKDPAGTKLFYGSVDDLLKQALQGNPKKSDLIPCPGEVDCISAGSPCQGFSKLNVARNNDTGLKNQSLVASVASYVDFYRPKYGILENVMAMAQKSGNRDKDVLSQLICAIVGIGFQLQVFVLDAWSTGSPQSRTRLFVAFAAPGLEPLKHPELSHSHPPKVRDFGLGKLANGQSFGHRIRGPTPFEYVTAGDATKDLP